jgi:hypothetical protein
MQRNNGVTRPEKVCVFGLDRLSLATMKLIPQLRRFLRRKATGFAVVAGLLTAAACWWLLPPTPRFSQKAEEGCYVDFSRGMRYLAKSTYEPNEKFSNGETVIWDVETGYHLCSFSFPKLYNHGFTEDETTFVEFSEGKAQFRDVITGKIKVDGNAVVFPYEQRAGKEPRSWLVTDAKGRLLVLVKEQESPWCFRDLLNGDEVASFSGPKVNDLEVYTDHFYFPGLLLFYNDEKHQIEAREIPNGKILFEKPIVRGSELLPLYDWKITPDGKKRIEVDGKIHIYDSAGGHRILDFAGDSIPVLSVDGRYLLVSVLNQTPHHPWVEWFFKSFFKSNSGTVVGFYDLNSEIKLATFTDAQFGYFSLDNRRMAIRTRDSWEIYDLPLQKPWPKIAAYALSVAGGVFLVGVAFGFFREEKVHGQSVKPHRRFGHEFT